MKTTGIIVCYHKAGSGVLSASALNVCVHCTHYWLSLTWYNKLCMLDNSSGSFYLNFMLHYSSW